MLTEVTTVSSQSQSIMVYGEPAAQLKKALIRYQRSFSDQAESASSPQIYYEPADHILKVGEKISPETLALHLICCDAPLIIPPELKQQGFIVATNEQQDATVYLPPQFSYIQLRSLLDAGFECLANKQKIKHLARDIAIIEVERQELSAIGTAMSAEKDLDKLLTMVLAEGRKFGHCEAASLYLLDERDKQNPRLLFKLTQNSKINFDFKEKDFPLTKQSLSGYVALTGETLNIADAYLIPKTAPYQFDKSFDLKAGYRTRELLVLPMQNHRGKIIGVLQFINNQSQFDQQSTRPGFSPDRESLLLSLASQAAVAIDNSQLIDSIQALFEGFVSASVKAIESRDPVTSGHSFRVAELTTGLAERLDNIDFGIYRTLKFNRNNLREIRYASLLHDFGKVGVKENVLLKPNKLHPNRSHYLELKIEWQKQVLQRRFYQRLVTQNDPDAYLKWQSSEEFEAMQNHLKQLDEFHHILEEANKPSLLEEEIAEELQHLFDYKMDSHYPFGERLLTEDDLLSLSVKKGSLTHEERIEIQSHVLHTQAFLNEIPWTDELAKVPTIAGSHHEKLDGSGYPFGIVDAEIPVASKIMAISDIFDALTARDRPYKKAVALDLALKILKDEASSGKLCHTMVDIFIESKVYNKVRLDH